jgi:hypothetical protein
MKKRFLKKETMEIVVMHQPQQPQHPQRMVNGNPIVNHEESWG